ncbi:MAG: alkaline phytoceramidase [Candidatus Riflebacteria bacterium]|nr:alkaline phytoceramidase [Candidatus Riflebacteria bacterium]
MMAVATLGWVAAKAPIPQNPEYHSFADQRMFAGIPNTFDTISNVAFMLVGGAGLWIIIRRRSQSDVQGEQQGAASNGGSQGSDNGSLIALRRDECPVYMAFFAGVFLVGLGSGWYHLHPDNLTLVWDRLPMTTAFLALGLLPVAERVSTRAANILLAPALICGLFSVVYWHLTESMGGGDLRPYLFVRVLPLFTLLLTTVLFPPRYTGGHELFIGVGLFALATIAEHSDKEIFAMVGIMSGHTIKHLLAAFGAYRVIVMLKHRSQIA